MIDLKRKKLIQQKWYFKNKKRIAKQKALYYRENIEEEKLRQKKWRDKNKEYLLKYQKEWNLKFHYGLSVQKFNDMVKEQNGKCLICNEEKRLCIDHDHKTGKVRGLICHRCNTLLVVFDNRGLFNRMIKYMEGYKND